MLFLPGTGGAPRNYKAFLQTASSLGYHGVGLSYVNGESMASYCGDAESGGCFEAARREVIDGVNRIAELNVDRANSIENRFARLLQYLVESRPGQNWQLFLGEDQTTVEWSRIVVAGHSQGGGHAGVMAMQREVARVLMFASTDWWNVERRPADWMMANTATPKERYFALGHQRDLLVRRNRFLAGWEALGLDSFGEIQAPELPSGRYFGGTHRLVTDVDPRIPTPLLDTHSAMIVDAYTPLDADGEPSIMARAWRYMLVAPIHPPTPTVAANVAMPERALSIRVATAPGFTYQLESSPRLDQWSREGTATAGGEDHGPAEWTFQLGSIVKRFWRVRVSFQ